MKVISVEREFWRDVRNAENSGEMCSVEYEMKISWPCTRAEFPHVNEKLRDKFDIKRRNIG